MIEQYSNKKAFTEKKNTPTFVKLIKIFLGGLWVVNTSTIISETFIRQEKR